MVLLSLASCGGVTPAASSSFVVTESSSMSVPESSSGNENPVLSPDFTLLYSRAAEVKNEASGLVLIEKTPAFSSAIARLDLAWGDAESPLKEYSPLANYTHFLASEIEYDFAPHALIPTNATHLWLSAYDASGNTLSQANLSFLTYKEEEQLLYSFEVLSDQQISTSSPCFYRRSEKAFADIAKNDPQSKGIFVNGDIVDEALAANYDSFFASFDAAYPTKNTPLVCGIGNHEFIRQSEEGSYSGVPEATLLSRYADRLALWKEKTGNALPYFSTMIEGSYAIFLGTTALPKTLDGNTRADCTIDEAEFTWLAETLSQAHATGKPIYLFSHGALRDTVSGSLTALRQNWYGYSQAIEQRLRSLIAPYPELLFFSSHSHWCFESVQPYLINEQGPSFFNTAAVGYLWQGEGAGEHYQKGSYENGGAQGLYVEVYPQSIYLKARQFEAADGVSQYFYSGYQTRLSRVKGVSL